jgi:cytochrome P450
VACVGLGKFTLYLLTHPDAVQHVLADNGGNYWKGAGIEMIKPVMGEGLAVAEGEAWKRQRRLMQPSFQRKRLAGFVPAMAEVTEAMVAGWEPAARTGDPLDVMEEASGLLQRLIVRVLFGDDLRADTGPLGEALVEVNAYVSTIVWSLLPTWVPSRRRRRFRRAMDLLDRTVHDLIQRRRAQGAGEREAGDLLGQLLAARDPETGSALDDRALRDQAMTLFVAGHDTTASAIAWSLALLAQHPSVAEAVVAEAQALPDVPGLDDLAGMGVTDRVIKEALRLYPPGWLMVRTPYEDDQVMGFAVPKDAPLLIPLWVLHRHPDHWEHPGRFDPDRFLPERAAGRHRYAYIPFGGGQRLCIGNAFAELAIKMALGLILRRHRPALVPGHPLVPQPLTTLRPKHGVRMTLSPAAR